MLTIFMKRHSTKSLSFLLSVLLIFSAFMLLTADMKAEGEDEETQEEELQDIALDAEHFPDAQFLKCLQSDPQVDKDADGVLSADERQNVKQLYLANKEIGSIQGIEYFPLLNILEVNENKLKKIDLSQNPEVISLNAANNQLSELVLPRKCSLYDLKVYSNQLTELDLSSAVDLKNINVSDNKLTVLDFTNNKNLESINLKKNRLTSFNFDGLGVAISDAPEVPSGQLYAIEVGDDLLFDLSKLPGKFEIERASAWQDAAVKSGNILKLADKRPTTVSYKYRYYGNEMTNFHLKIDYYELVDFLAAGGEGSMPSVKLPENTEYKLPACAFKAPADKKFHAWSINGREYKPEDKITVKRNTKVAAVWQDLNPAPKKTEVSLPAPTTETSLPQAVSTEEVRPGRVAKTGESASGQIPALLLPLLTAVFIIKKREIENNK